MEHTPIHWDTIEAADRWLDAEVSSPYQRQPLAQDWARVSKVVEEAGEAISALILHTGQNPRKPQVASSLEMLEELGDVMITALLAVQHFTKDTLATSSVLEGAIAKLQQRTPTEYYGSYHEAP